MSRAPIDLFDDPDWSAEARVGEAPKVSPRPCLTASLALVALLLFSMQFPWLALTVTPQAGSPPLSGLLSRGWLPGTQDWGFLMLALGVFTALAIVIGLLWPMRSLLIALFVLATVLLLVTIAEAFASSFGDPWPYVHSGYGAWIGAPAVGFAWCCTAAATALSLSRARPPRTISRPTPRVM